MNNDLKNWCTEANKKIQSDLNMQNVMAIPKIEKIVVNTGIKSAASNNKFVASAMDLLKRVTCQLPVKTLAKKSIAGFKLRQGMPIGAYVTLRGSKMYFFLYKLIHVVLPKVRDFQGLSNKMDGRGNYTMGLASLDVFPEGEVSGVAEFSTGASITIVTNTDSDKKALTCLRAFGIPFKKSINIKV